MCGSMVDIQSSAAEIRRGEKKKERRRKKIETTGQKYNGYWPALLRTAVIITDSDIAFTETKITDREQNLKTR